MKISPRFSQSIFVLWIISVLLLPVRAEETASSDYYVIYVDGSELYLDVTAATGGVLGGRYIIERLGAVLTHPVTGKELGRARTKIGVVEISMLQDEFARAKIVHLEGDAKIHVKDLARPLEPAANPPVAESIRPSTAHLRDGANPASSSFEKMEFKEAGEISFELADVPVDMASADLDGDGRDEIIVAVEKRIDVYGIDAGSLVKKHTLDIGWLGDLLFVDAGDADGNGVPEVYVTLRQGASIRTDVYVPKDGELKKETSKRDMYLRTVEFPGGTRLYGQRFSQRAPFQRGVYRMELSPGEWSEAPSGLPQSVNLFDFAPLGSEGYVAAIDFENRIVLYNETGDRLWRSGEAYGGSSLRLKSGDRTSEEEFRGGLMAFDFDRDGSYELMAVRNQSDGGALGAIKLGRLVTYSGGQILMLAAEGNYLAERWKTKTYNGEIRSLRIGNPRGDGDEAIFLSIEKISWRDKKARIYSLPL